MRSSRGSCISRRCEVVVFTAAQRICVCLLSTNGRVPFANVARRATRPHPQTHNNNDCGHPAAKYAHTAHRQAMITVVLLRPTVWGVAGAPSALRLTAAPES